ncbi:nucleotide-diphospho-sugar transferase family protein [Actinidia rufa]|uniref:Glycosyltransferase n=1 Tax=Actinidia rufa TaxID=165716 RepID=A0A7J0FBL4_9ERIC|nr:nucleotide-diphospho-sugar transferase family protein [Actinidia rufa]
MNLVSQKMKNCKLWGPNCQNQKLLGQIEEIRNIRGQDYNLSSTLTWQRIRAHVTRKLELVKLMKVLEKAAMEDKSVIITTLNEAWAAPNSVFDVFLESFEIGNQTQRLLNHLVVVAMDQKAYSRCLALHPHCYALSTNGKDFSAEAHFMSTDYLEMMWRRIGFLHSVLNLGYSFVFTDADVVWFRDPFSRFYVDGDFQIACDFFLGNSSDPNNQPNGGFNYVKSNNRTIEFYKFWYVSRATYPGFHDQDVFNRIKFHPYLSQIGIKIRFLDTKYFGGFCQPSKDLNQVRTMHANCCIGLDRKIHDLKVTLEDWRKFLMLPANLKASQPSSWTVPQICGL